MPAITIVVTRSSPLAGDLIVTCVGTVGETAIVPEGITFSADRNLAGIRLVSKSIVNRMLQYVLNSPSCKHVYVRLQAQRHSHTFTLATFVLCLYQYHHLLNNIVSLPKLNVVSLS